MYACMHIELVVSWRLPTARHTSPSELFAPHLPRIQGRFMASKIMYIFMSSSPFSCDYPTPPHPFLAFPSLPFRSSPLRRPSFPPSSFEKYVDALLDYTVLHSTTQFWSSLLRPPTHVPKIQGTSAACVRACFWHSHTHPPTHTHSHTHKTDGVAYRRVECSFDTLTHPSIRIYYVPRQCGIQAF